jgi:hypothetical protein
MPVTTPVSMTATQGELQECTPISRPSPASYVQVTVSTVLLPAPIALPVNQLLSFTTIPA